jgi:hypothetical protein
MVALIATACGGGSKLGEQPGSSGSTGAAGGTGSPSTGNASGKPKSPQPTTSLTPPSHAVTPSPAGTGPSPFVYPWTPSPDVPVDAKVSPTCVRRGGLVTLTVHTKPKAGVAYIAVYSDNGNGAPKPTGNGYGGNDSGYSSPTGDFTSAFNVSFEAPSGPARVDVIVGVNNVWGYDAAPFAVAGPNGSC